VIKTVILLSIGKKVECVCWYFEVQYFCLKSDFIAQGVADVRFFWWGVAGAVRKDWGSPWQVTGNLRMEGWLH